MVIAFDPGSYRDPAGSVFYSDNRVFRAVSASGALNVRAAFDAGIFEAPEIADRIVPTTEIENAEWRQELGAELFLEHEKVPFISYPYEWSFEQLKAAAICHLELQLHLLERNFCLEDASAYNIQFIGSRPIFIDPLSIRPYRDGEFWLGHRQFCEQFLNPLLLRALGGVAHNAWYRGSPDGINADDINKVIPFLNKFSLNYLSHIYLPARMARSAAAAPDAALSRARSAKTLSRNGYRSILQQLLNWVKSLKQADGAATTWGNYATTNTYSTDESKEKGEAIAQFASDCRPGTLIDLGCNTGDYSIAALRGGAGYVVGFDFDQRGVDAAYSRSVQERLSYLPLWLDASNPSPDQGWQQSERQGLAQRARSDAVIALAFEHHLAIAKNIPLTSVVRWITDMAPRGVIEFVPKSDPTVQTMLALREDIFPDYTEQSFVQALESQARIVGRKQSSSSGRVLFIFDRT